MSHANAALTPRARLRLARLIVDQGWPPARAAERYDVSWKTAKKWADRYRTEGPAGMSDRSSRPHHQPNRTPAPVVRKIVHLRWKQRLGPVEIGDRLGMPASTVHAVLVRCRLNRLSHIDRATGEPIRRYEHDASRRSDPRRRQEARQGPRRRRLALRRPPTRREEPVSDCVPHRHAAQQALEPADRHLLPAHRDRRPLPGRLRRGPRRRDQGDRDRGAAQRRRLVRRTRRHRATRAVRQRQLLPVPPVARDLRRASASHRRRPGPTGHRPTARSNGSTAPWPRAGHSRSSTTPNQPDSPLCQHGSTSTTTTGPTQQSARPHPSPGWTTWLGITAS